MKTGKIRQVVFLLMVFIVFACLLEACRPGKNKENYVTTIHPFEQIIQSVLGSSASVKKLMPAGASPHTFNLKPSDLQKAADALALFVGHEHLDRWAYDIPDVEIIEMMSFIPEKYLRPFDSGEQGMDPHFWTDPLTVMAMLPALTKRLIRFQPQDSVLLLKNITRFMQDLDELNSEIEQKLAPFAGSAIVLSHPFFRYYLLRYKFRIIDIIEPHPGSSPTPGAIQEKINLYKKENVRLILTHPAHSDRIARLIAESTNSPVCKTDPLGGADGRVSYRDILIYNTDKIVEALQ